MDALTPASTAPLPGGGALPLPRFWEFQAPPAWRSIDFISDLHLQPSHPRTFDAFVRHLQHTPADAVFVLGDLFEVWIGDDARHDGFEHQVVEALAEAGARRALAFMAGNRDFLVGTELLQACGMLALPDPTVLRAFGERILLTHGDALCLEDVEYQRFRAAVRTDQAQADFLRRPLAERRALAAHVRQVSMQKQQRDGRLETWADLDAATTVRWMHEAGTPVLVHGHTHRPAVEELAPGFSRYVLTDWELDEAAQPPRAGVLRLDAGGLRRVAPSGGNDAGDDATP